MVVVVVRLVDSGAFKLAKLQSTAAQLYRRVMGRNA